MSTPTSTPGANPHNRGPGTDDHIIGWHVESISYTATEISVVIEAFVIFKKGRNPAIHTPVNFFLNGGMKGSPPTDTSGKVKYTFVVPAGTASIEITAQPVGRNMPMSKQSISLQASAIPVSNPSNRILTIINTGHEGKTILHCIVTDEKTRKPVSDIVRISPVGLSRWGCGVDTPNPLLNAPPPPTPPTTPINPPNPPPAPPKAGTLYKFGQPVMEIAVNGWVDIPVSIPCASLEVDFMLASTSDHLQLYVVGGPDPDWDKADGKLQTSDASTSSGAAGLRKLVLCVTATIIFLIFAVALTVDMFALLVPLGVLGLIALLYFLPLNGTKATVGATVFLFLMLSVGGYWSVSSYHDLPPLYKALAADEETIKRQQDSERNANQSRYGVYATDAERRGVPDPPEMYSFKSYVTFGLRIGLIILYCVCFVLGIALMCLAEAGSVFQKSARKFFGFFLKTQGEAGKDGFFEQAKKVISSGGSAQATPSSVPSSTGAPANVRPSRGGSFSGFYLLEGFNVFLNLMDLLRRG